MIINTFIKKNFVKNILKFIFYLRYLILIFIFSIILLLTLPKLFKYVNKIDELNYILKNQHGFTIKKTNKIKYKIFPLPNLEIKDSQISIEEQYSDVKIKKLIIFINLKSLYVSEEISLKKIKFEGNFLDNDIIGHYVPKKDKNYLYFKVKNLGIESKVFLDNKKKLPKPSGLIKLKVLDDNFLINFDFDKNLQFKNSFYKNKNIYTNFKGQLNFEPFFYFKIIADIKKLNLESLKLNKLYHLVIDETSGKKLNGSLSINYLTKKIIDRTGTKNNKINIIFNNGDIISKDSNFQFANLDIQLNFYFKKYPSYKDLEYELLIETENINKFYKIISVKKDKKIRKVKTLINGKINLDAQKFYLDKIIVNEKYIEENKLAQLKNYLDKNTINFLNSDLNTKEIYLFLKDLIELI